MPPDHRVAAFAPGRVNLIGEHTDHQGGLALAFAIEQGVTVRAEALAGARVEAIACDLGERDAFAVGDPGLPGSSTGWRAFVRGVVGELEATGVDVPGCRLEIGGSIPRGGGLSSSAALSGALALALLALAGAPEPDRIALARLCSRVENRWVGAQTGLLDQLTVLLGKPGHALRLDFASSGIEPVALDLWGWRLATLDSGAAHDHGASGYNERRAECARACERLGVGSLSEATAEGIRGLPEPLARRARHVVEENARVEATIAALAAGNLAEVGRLLDACHASLRDLFEVSVLEVEATVARARDSGAAGARIMGGGFGGHVLALFGPGVALPGDALEVRPGGAARLVA